MNKFIPLSVPNLKGKELEYITKAVETEWVSSGGSYVNEFEDKIVAYTGAKGAVSCQNGTAGLHVALQLCGVERGDEVVVPTLTFIAAVNPVKYIGAEPIFMDCDDSLTIDTEKMAEFFEEHCDFSDGKLTNRLTNRRIKVILPVHVFGNMANMERIMALAEQYNLKVIEDATEALGTYYTAGKYKGRHAGTIGDIGVYSFNGNKIITTGGGGMIVSDNSEYFKKAKHLTTQAKSDELYFEHDEIGYNYRLTNLQAAMGVAQLEQLEQFIATKKANYEHYKKAFEQIDGLTLLDFRDDIRPNYWFYALYCGEEYALNRDEIIPYLSSKKVQSRPVWGLISEQKPYADSQAYKIEKALDYLQHIVNIPCSSNLSSEDAAYVVDCFKSAEK